MARLVLATLARPYRGLDDPCLRLHGSQGFWNERGYLMGLFAAVSKRLVKREVRQRETTQRRALVVASVDSDRTVKDVNAVSAHSSAQREERCRGMAK